VPAAEVVAVSPLEPSGADQPANAEPGAIREEIARTRAEMSSTIDAIQERLDPERLVEQAKDAAQTAVQETKGAVREATIGKAEQMVTGASETARDASSSIMDTIRDNPVPATLAAVGLGWLFLSGRSRPSAARPSYPARGYPSAAYAPPTEQPGRAVGQAVGSTSEAVGKVADRAQDVVGQAASTAQDLATQAADKASQVVGDASQTATGAGSSLLGTVRQNPVPAALIGLGIVWLLRGRGSSATSAAPYTSPLPSSRGPAEAVGDLASQAQNQAGMLADQAQARAQAAQGQLQRLLTDNPLAVGAVALGVGAAVGLAAPGTRQENQLLGEARDRVLDQAQTVIQETQHKVQRVAEQAHSAAKEEAARQDLSQ
jgi:ElaB/YqjD/DUF883 family membrane-anchored ribosome-binding protein